MLLLHPALTCPDGVTLLPSAGTNTPLAHLVITRSTCAGGIFLLATGAHTPLALCGGGIWWPVLVVYFCIFVAVVVVAMLW